MGKIRDLFILFIIFAVCGWIYEAAGTVIVYGYFENRGFLFGPWLPIYGFGGIALYALFGRIVRKPAKPVRVILRIAVLVVCIAVITAALELAASYLLDAVGIGYRSLWFYDGEPLNFDGRVGLFPSIRFGVMGVVALYLAVPLWERFIGMKNKRLLNISSYAVIGLFLLDLALRIPLGSNM